MTTIEKIQQLGYFVGPGAVGDDGEPLSYRIVGYGLNTQVATGDDEQLAEIADPDAHAQRELETEHPELTTTVGALAGRGYRVELDVPHRKLLVTAPGAASATGYTPKEAADFLEGLGPYDPVEELRQTLKDAKTLPELKQAIGQLLDILGR